MRARTILIGVFVLAVMLAGWQHDRVEARQPPVRVTSPISGAVAEIYVGVDTDVKAGQPLLRIDSPVLRARLEEAKADLEMERSAEINAAAELVDADVQPQKETMVLGKLEFAKADIQRCELAVADAENAARQQWVRSPLDGRVVAIKAQIGGSSSKVLLEIAPKGAM